MLELAILGLLKERPMHGYDLRKRLRDELGPFNNLSFGSLYPALGRLERHGAVMVTLAAERADEAVVAPRSASARAAAALGGHGTRARKVYELTERGELVFEELLQAIDTGDDPRSFVLRLGFARHLGPPARLRLLERRRMQLLDRVERARRLLETRRGADRYTLAILEHSLELARADLVWVERLLAIEVDGVPTPGGGDPLVATAPHASRTGDWPGSDSAAVWAEEEAGAQRAVPPASVGGIAGILHAGRLRRRPDGGRSAPQQPNRQKEQIRR